MSNELALTGPGERFKPFRDSGYHVSSNGRVRSPRRRILKQKMKKNGYMRVTLSGGKQQYVHRMALIAFRGEPPSALHESDHRNKDRADNRLSNLRWRTKAKNLADRTFARGEDQGLSKLLESDVRKILAGPFYLGRDRIIARSLGVSREQVRDIRLGKYWKHLGQPGESR